MVHSPSYKTLYNLAGAFSPFLMSHHQSLPLPLFSLFILEECPMSFYASLTLLRIVPVPGTHFSPFSTNCFQSSRAKRFSNHLPGSNLKAEPLAFPNTCYTVCTFVTLHSLHNLALTDTLVSFSF